MNLKQVINESAEVVKGAKLPSDTLLKQFYRDMVRMRAVDDKAFKLQRQGRLGTYPQIKGHEAIQIGTAHAMYDEDWIVPSYREGGLMALRGVDFGDILLFWAGNEMGSHFANNVRCFPIAIPIASQIPHGVGFAWGAKLKKEKCAVVTCFGDGATSEGEFHEGLNFAGVFKTPNVFLCSNNQFAISVGRDRQTASSTLAEKAFAYGFDGVMVDGMDVIAVYQVMKEAIDKARAGKGPTLVEAVTYRLCDHTTADDASIYQNPAEKEQWHKRDGVMRLQKLLIRQGLWSDQDEKNLEEESKRFVEQVVTKLESTPHQTPRNIFEHTFAEMPPRLQYQLADLESFTSAEKK